jgi:hypothetical protein
LENKQVSNICDMCTVRCPIQVEVIGDRIKFIQGNPHAAGLEGALCARGGAGLALVEDEERPQYPLIRTGKRGEGQWRQDEGQGNRPHPPRCPVFMVHGFGHNLPIESRALGKGVSDSALMPGGLALWDQAGGGMALQEHFVTVTKIKSV